ncbi:hypothetical protein FWG76_00265 [Candidatus Saccharibacteria bacterium]|nr:hypothetical protein [Candidatus Saccharibacteria bacterium]
MDNIIGNGKLGGLVTYLDMLKEKGRVPAGVATSLKTAVSKVFQATDGDGWQEVDARNLDLEDYMTRFQNLTMGQYNEGSYAAYRARAAKALGWYNTFLSSPGWSPTPTSKKTSSEKKTGQKGKTNVARQTIPAASNHVGTTTSVPGTAATKLVAFPFPLTTGELATLHLPTRLSRSDGYRLAKFLEALVSDGTSMIESRNDER